LQYAAKLLKHKEEKNETFLWLDTTTHHTSSKTITYIFLADLAVFWGVYFTPKCVNINLFNADHHT
jgi:hypothetical protein